MDINILAIESSCDDTSCAILHNGKIISNVTASQSVHKKYGGVVPELASRAHLANIVPTADLAMKKAGIHTGELSAVAFTRGPGLLGSLIVGVSFAKGLALRLGIPLIEVHHLEAHIHALFISETKPLFPFLNLTVSGGHTQISIVRAPLDIEIIGSTRDDAAGEAFDKAGKMLGLNYPAGPVIDQLSRTGKAIFEFPEPKIPGLDFSFSGLKTSILRFLQKRLLEDPDFIRKNLNDICASIQARIVSILIKKLSLAVKETGITEIGIAGGVSGNTALRRALKEAGKEHNWKVYIPPMEYCTDNAAMIAMSGYFKYLEGLFTDQSVTPEARWKG